MLRRNLFVAAVALFSGSAFAAECTTSPCIEFLNVSTEVVASCSSLQAADLDFGARPAIAGQFDVTTNLNLVCTVGTPYTVELDYGFFPTGAGSTQRQVSDFATGQFIDYTVFQPGAGGAAATTAPWGRAVNGQEYTGLGNGATQTLTATGRLDQNASVGPGVYTDLITVYLNY